MFLSKGHCSGFESAVHHFGDSFVGFAVFHESVIIDVGFVQIDFGISVVISVTDVDFCVLGGIFSAVFVAERVETDFLGFDRSAVRDGDDGLGRVVFTHFVDVIPLSLDNLIYTFSIAVIRFVKRLVVSGERDRGELFLYAWDDDVRDTKVHEEVFADLEVVLGGVVLGVGDEGSVVEELLVDCLGFLVFFVTCFKFLLAVSGFEERVDGFSRPFQRGDYDDEVWFLGDIQIF